jgi:myo-inositol-1(or 4)-monophosphatase
VAASDRAERLGSELLDALEPTIDQARELVRSMTPLRREKSTEGGLVEPLTDVDLAVEALLVERLRQLAPGVVIVSEESLPDVAGIGAALCVVLDPIDGTKELVMGSKHFGISVAVLSEGRPIAALVDFPAMGTRIRSRDDRSVLCDGQLLSPKRPPADDPAGAARRSIAASAAQLAELRSWKELVRTGWPRPVGAFTPKIASVLLGQSSLAVRLPHGRDALRIWDYIAAGHLLSLQGMRLHTLDGRSLMEELPEVHRSGWVAGPSRLCDAFVAIFKAYAPNQAKAWSWDE